jgi:hypothetical protein
MAKSYCTNNRNSSQESSPSSTTDLLKAGLQLSQCWPAVGETSPPNGYSPSQMRQEIISVILSLEGRLLLSAFYVAMHFAIMSYEQEEAGR